MTLEIAIDEKIRHQGVLVDPGEVRRPSGAGHICNIQYGVAETQSVPNAPA